MTISGGRTEQLDIIAVFLPRHWLYDARYTHNVWFEQGIEEALLQTWRRACFSGVSHAPIQRRRARSIRKNTQWEAVITKFCMMMILDPRKITGCAVAQHCYNGDGSFLWGRCKIWPPVKSKPVNRLTHNLSELIMSTRGTLVPNLVIKKSIHGGLLGKLLKYNFLCDLSYL